MVRTRQLAFLLAVGLGASTWTSTARAQEKSPERSLRYASLTVARLNPLGLITRNDLTYRWRLFDSDSPLLRANHFGIGGLLVASPAFFRVGPTIEFQPLSILEFRVAYESFSYFGTFDFFQSFQFVTDDFSDTALDNLSASEDEAERNYSTAGTQFTATGIFRVKYGPVAARNTFRLMRSDFRILRDGDQLFYDPIWDLLVADEGWFMNNDVDLLVFLGDRLKVGARWTYATAFYEEKHFPEGSDLNDPNNPTNRLGPVMTYTFPSKSRFFQEPTLLVVANWWLEHRFRTGQDVTVGLPYIVVGLNFTGDIWTSNDSASKKDGSS